LQVWLDRLERIQQDAGTIRAGDPLALRFASFGKGSFVEAPRLALINPASISIGEETRIRAHVCIEALAPPGQVVIRIGSRVQLGYFCRFVAVNGIEIEDEAGIGHGATIADTIHDWKSQESDTGWKNPLKLGLPMRIERGAWIGNNSVVTGGITIGARAIVTPNSVINRNVPADTIVGGSPARVLRRKRPDGEWEWLIDPATLDLETQAAAAQRDGPPAGG
jgi:acetyltransferase-like isoleucine patch superfamily enzyme